jgi:IS30 family transposase
VGESRAFAALIARGIGSAEACRLVGVNRRTGKRWRHGRTITSSSGQRLHYPPVIYARKREISPRFLSEDERIVIGDRRRAGYTVRAIAQELGRSPATISRELRRNCDPDSGQYRSFAAQRLATKRRARPRKGKLVSDARLRSYVVEALQRRWSPEQISQALRGEFVAARRDHESASAQRRRAVPRP